jgi:hypothetical protein
MRDAVTLSLEAGLRRCLPTAALRFDSPVAGFPEDGGQSTVRAFLYDVREEEYSQAGNTVVRDSSSKVMARIQPSRLFQYSYQLTASAPDWQECYRLLGEVMRAASAHSAIPNDLLHPMLAGFRSGAVRLIAAPIDPVPVPWSGAQVPVSPVLPLVVIAPMPVDRDENLEKAPDRIDIGTGTGFGPSDGNVPRRSVVRPRGRIEE